MHLNSRVTSLGWLLPESWLPCDSAALERPACSIQSIKCQPTTTICIIPFRPIWARKLLTLSIPQTHFTCEGTSKTLNVANLAVTHLLFPTMWKHLFYQPAHTLERSAANATEYMTSDNDPLVAAYIDALFQTS